MTGANLPASIQARLLQRARTEGRDYTQVLTRYGLERLLYRLSVSAYAENFLLKGALLFDLCDGDAVTPEAETAEYQVLLGSLPAPVLRVYPRYTVVAEKLEAIITLGLANTRMKDYFDLWVLSEHESFDYETLAMAIRATLGNRQTQMPSGIPLGLSDEFSADPEKQRQWAAFLSKNRLVSPPLESVVERLREWLVPPMQDLGGHHVTSKGSP